MATANDLLTRAIDETKHLNHNEIFLVRDLFKGYEWNRISMCASYARHAVPKA